MRRQAASRKNEGRTSPDIRPSSVPGLRNDRPLFSPVLAMGVPCRVPPGITQEACQLPCGRIRRALRDNPRRSPAGPGGHRLPCVESRMALRLSPILVHPTAARAACRARRPRPEAG